VFHKCGRFGQDEVGCFNTTNTFTPCLWNEWQEGVDPFTLFQFNQSPGKGRADLSKEFRRSPARTAHL